MKTQLFISESKIEIHLSGGIVRKAKKGETQDDLVQRVKDEVALTSGEELEIKIISADKFSKYSTKQLQKSRVNKKGIELVIVNEILAKRGALDEHPSEDGVIVNTTRGVEDVKANGKVKNPAPTKKEPAAKPKTPKKDKTPSKEENLSQQDLLKAMNDVYEKAKIYKG